MAMLSACLTGGSATIGGFSRGGIGVCMLCLPLGAEEENTRPDWRKRGTEQRAKLSNRFEALHDGEHEVEWIQWCAEDKEGKHLGKRDGHGSWKVSTHSDWAGDLETRISTSGGIIMLGDHCLKTWRTNQSSPRVKLVRS